MKILNLILLICIGFISCSKNELTKEEAMVLLNTEKGFPRSAYFEIFTSDPEYAKKLSATDLESDGYVVIQKTQKLGEVGNALVSFTEKAKPFLLKATDDDLKMSVQSVKIADETVVEIKSVNENKSSGTMEVYYVTNFKNATPFAVLVKNLDKPKDLSATFKFDGDKWVLVKHQ
ncbi:hypothetical protein [Flavobacterium lindanitolerans]|uniref:hypothetical protein n=1 Tax=Flavobacterium lindanitolerans TaxID=428988 RepID=UPI0023F08A10|nr:hypothetical protein [Flavobacterium lindanitolerans]